MMLKLSIIIPLYNVESYVAQCFESIYNQGLDESEFEVIVVDDESTDNSPSIVQGFAESHPNIHLFFQPHQGIAPTRNYALVQAKGEYIYYCDPDDYVLPHKLPLLIAEADREQADIVRADFCRLIDETGEMKASESKYDHSKRIVDTGKNFMRNHFDPTQCFLWINLFRRDFLEANAVRFPMLVRCSDVPYSLESFYLASKVVFVPEVVYVYRINDSSITARKGHYQWFKTAFVCNQELESLFNRHSVTDDIRQKFHVFSLKSGLKQTIWSFIHHKNYDEDDYDDYKKSVRMISRDIWSKGYYMKSALICLYSLMVPVIVRVARLYSKKY